MAVHLGAPHRNHDCGCDIFDFNGCDGNLGTCGSRAASSDLDPDRLPDAGLRSFRCCSGAVFYSSESAVRDYDHRNQSRGASRTLFEIWLEFGKSRARLCTVGSVNSVFVQQKKLYPVGPDDPRVL
jgi:hypothetical protein